MSNDRNAVSLGSVLITLGIVFGDIGTSPLYVFTAITGGSHFSSELILGSLSCIFWTLILLTTFKYVYLALNADNQGEGGIFALYALLRKTKSRWIIFPALIGCATLISDGFLTPAISISSAVEGLNLRLPQFPTTPVVLAIVVFLFLFQQWGTQVIGRFFGPVMLLWFLTLGMLGLNQLWQNPSVLQALNPWMAVRFVGAYPEAIWILGAVFLCTTGAEALFSDLGHCGKSNIRISWSFVFVMLLINYFGQAAYCLNLQEGNSVPSVFYATVPPVALPFVVGIATIAAIVASQALITGIFTLVNEAIKLRLWTNLKVKYPASHKGQVYIPFINYFLMLGCISVILLFGKSSNMEAAYGLSIIIDMLMTSILLGYLLYSQRRRNALFLLPAMLLIISVEFVFLFSNLGKLLHGGWFSLLIASGIFILLFLYYNARKLRQKVADYVPMTKIVPVLQDVMNDPSIPYDATNLIYPARTVSDKRLDGAIAYSLFRMRPKKASVYWFLHIDTTNKPWGVDYEIKKLIPQRCFYVRLRFGFKEDHYVELIMKKIHADLAASGEIEGVSAYASMRKHQFPPDFRFILLNARVARDNDLSAFQLLSIRVYRFVKSIGWSSADDFGLDKTNVVEEYVPIEVTGKIPLKIERKGK